MPGTVRDGRVSTATQGVGVRLDIDEAIQILTPSDVPLQRWVGSEATDQIKYEWLEEDLTPQTVVVSAVSGTGPWNVTVDDASITRPGDVLQLHDGVATVQFSIDSINTTTNVIVVSGFAGNTTGPVATNSLDIIGQYRIEGSDPEEARSIDRTTNFNYTQIMQEKVEATRTARKRGLYGQGDPYDHELQKKFKELAIRFERAMVNGQRAISVAQDKRFMGGLFYFVTTNTSSGVKANAYSLVNDLIRKVYDAGGTPGTLMVSPSVKAAISANVDPTLRRSTRGETTGGYVIDSILTDFGQVDIVPNRHFPKTKGFLMQREFIKRKVFDGYFHEMLAKTGDADKGEVVAELGLEVKNEKAHGILTLTDA
jgi:hypothetical protein